ncbi:MAG: molybdopterin-binding protein [Myxococcales bacterium]
MRIEVICTGDEVLTGKIVNTNFSYITQKLEDFGLSVRWETTVGDDREDLLLAFRLAGERADVVILLMDANEAAVDQDARIADIANEKGKALIVVVNKWDIVPDKKKTEQYYREEITKRLPFISYAPMLFASAKTGSHVFQALELAGALYEEYTSRVPTPLLNQFLEKIVDEHPAPRASGGLPVRLFYIAQIGQKPPTFALTSNKPADVAEDYKRFIVNRMRDAFGLRVPIRLVFKRKSKKRFVARPGPRGKKR